MQHICIEEHKQNCFNEGKKSEQARAQGAPCNYTVEISLDFFFSFF